MAVMAGTSGNDNLFGTGSADTIDGGAGNDSLSGLDGNDSVVGSGGNDTLRGNNGADWLEGGAGNDNLGGGSGQDSFVLREMGAANADLLLDFAADWDNIQLDAAAFTAIGDTGRWTTGDDRFHSAAGATGGADAEDRIIFNSSTGQLFYDADGNGAGAAQLIATLPSGRTVIASDFWVFGTPGSAVIRGTDGDDSLTGTAGNDSIEGLAGNDTLNGGAGADTMDGGLHDDVFVVDDRDDVVIELEGGGSNDEVRSSVSYTLPDWVNNLTLTGTASLNGTGNELANILTGNDESNSLLGRDGDDTLGGQGGNDWLEGGLGDDTILGGAGRDGVYLDGLGRDFIDGGSESDYLSVRFDLTDVVVDLSAGTVSWGGATAGSAQLANIEEVNGSGGADRVTGDGVANDLAGYGGNDTLAGGAGDDTLWGMDGDDVLHGDADWDWLLGGFGNDSLNGGAGVDSLRGDAGDDTLLGGDDSDWFWFGNNYGNDLVDGGAGTDVVLFAEGSTQSSVVVNLADGTLEGGGDGGAGRATLVSIEHAGGGRFDDRITGSETANSVSGGDGNDVVEGAGGNDTVTGEAGNDTLLGGAGNDYVNGYDDVNWIEGGTGNDTLIGGYQADSYVFRDAPGAGNADLISDYIFTSGLDKVVLDGTAHANAGPSGNFVAGDARFAAGAGITSGQDASDRVIYNTSTGQLWYDFDGNGSGASQLIATIYNARPLAATDIAIVNGSGGGTPPAVITGTPGNDSLTGTAGNDSMEGLAGNDTLDGGTGADTMGGGLHDDVFIVDDVGDVVIEVEGGGSNDEVRSSVSYTLSDWVNNLTLTGTSTINGAGNALDNIVAGNSAANLLEGGAGIDTLLGGDGDDTLLGGDGDDALHGGAGNDTYIVTPGDAIADSGGMDHVKSATSWALQDGLENLTIETSEFFVEGTGNELDNSLRAVGDDVRLYGRGGNDLLQAESRYSVLYGGDANDTLIGSRGFNQLFGDAGDDLLDDGLDDTLAAFGEGGANFAGGAGNDTIFGGAADDLIQLGHDYGQDWIDGGGGRDSITFEEAASGVVVNLTAGTATGGGPGGSGSATLASVENVFGGDFADRITGDSGANRLVGRAYFYHPPSDTDGNDTLDGLAGNDTLEGGPGADQLVFSVAPGAANADWIRDFASNTDKIVLDGNAHTNTGPSGDFAAGDGRFRLASSAQDADDRVVYDSTTGQLWYDADGNGAGAMQLIATLEGAPALAASDLAIVNGSGSVITGTSGNDSLTGTSGNDSIEGLAGNDTLVGGGGRDRLDGGAGNDTLIGSDHAETQAQMLDGGTGADSMVGGSGGDVFYVDDAGDTVSDRGGHDAVFTTITFLAPEWLEQLTLLGSANASITGNALSNNLHGNVGANVIVGQGGSDWLDGGAAGDTLAGGLGLDTLTGGEGSDVFAFDTAPGFANADSLTDFSSSAGDLIQLDGNAMGALGPSGRFAAGDARFRLGASAQDADDRVIYDADTGQLWYDADGNGGGGAQLIATLQGAPGLAATGIAVVNGSSGVISGTPGNDSLTGTSGDDTIDGGAGADTMNGGQGNDTYYVTAGDVIQDSGGTDQLFAETSFALPSAIEHITYLGSANTSSAGNWRANAMTGNAGRNFLDGREGNDTLYGAEGNDTLQGRTGADTFVFGEMGAAHADSVADFLPGTDQIALDDAAFALSGDFVAGDGRFRAGAGVSSGQDADDRVLYNTSTGQLYYDADGSGSGASQLVATLGGSPAVSATDIGVI